MTVPVSTCAAETPAPETVRRQEVEINGRILVSYRTGSGSPAVILETGLGSESDEWRPIQRSIGEVTLAWRYDRAGRGGSGAAPTSPRSAGAMVEDLHELLRSAAIPGPYLLVGHSFGGLLVRLYAYRHPREVCGLVLVDAMHPDQFRVIGGALPPSTPDDPPPLDNFRKFWTGGSGGPQARAASRAHSPLRERPAPCCGNVRRSPADVFGCSATHTTMSAPAVDSEPRNNRGKDKERRHAHATTRDNSTYGHRLAHAKLPRGACSSRLARSASARGNSSGARQR